MASDPLTSSQPEDPIFHDLEQLILASESAYHLSSSTAADTTTTDYDKVSAILASHGVPSTSIAILSAGHISTKCYTTRRSRTDNRPLDVPATMFQACSISKPVAGTTLLHLMSSGRYPQLSLTAPVASLLPADVLDLIAADPRTRAAFDSLTLKHLMSHTAGLSAGGFPGYPVDTHEEAPNLSEVLNGRLLDGEAGSGSGFGVNTVKVRVIAPPGAQFMYSGGGILVIQMIIQHVTGRSFEDVTKEYLFEPLGMKRSRWRLTDEDRRGDGDESESGGVSQSYSTGYTKCDVKWTTLPEMAAGGLWTTPEDLMKLVRAVNRVLNDDSTRVAGEGELGLMKRDLAQAMLTKIKHVQMGIGLTWFVNEQTYGHGGGNYPGYRCFAFGYADLPGNKPEKADDDDKDVSVAAKVPACTGFAVMTNSAQGYGGAYKIMNAIAYLKGWPEAPLSLGFPENGVSFTVAADGERAHEWKEWIGEWSDKNNANSLPWHIVEEDGGPAAWVESPQALFKLKPAAYPPKLYSEGRRSIDLVVHGCEMMLRLGWNKDGRIVDVWNHNSNNGKTLSQHKK